jgi:DNA-binding MarR family transcriptional regulator
MTLRNTMQQHRAAGGLAFKKLCLRLTTSFQSWKLVVMLTRTRSTSIKAQRSQALTELTLTVFRLNGVLLQWGDSLARPLGLTSARWQMLGAIALAEKPLTAPQIAEAMGVSRQGAQKQLNVLQDAKLVAPRANPAHRRSQLYELTPLGRKQYDSIDQLWREQAAQIAQHLPDLTMATQTLGAFLGQLALTTSTEEQT